MPKFEITLVLIADVEAVDLWESPLMDLVCIHDAQVEHITTI